MEGLVSQEKIFNSWKTTNGLSARKWYGTLYILMTYCAFYKRMAPRKERMQDTQDGGGLDQGWNSGERSRKCHRYIRKALTRLCGLDAGVD